MNMCKNRLSFHFQETKNIVKFGRSSYFNHSLFVTLSTHDQLFHASITQRQSACLIPFTERRWDITTFPMCRKLSNWAFLPAPAAIRLYNIVSSVFTRWKTPSRAIRTSICCCGFCFVSFKFFFGLFLKHLSYPERLWFRNGTQRSW